MSTVRTMSIAVVLLMLVVIIDGKPLDQPFNPLDSTALIDPEKLVCTAQTASLCQQCAKKTKSAVVYPWCCANHEGVQEWCESYLHFGLP